MACYDTTVCVRRIVRSRRGYLIFFFNFMQTITRILHQNTNWCASACPGSHNDDKYLIPSLLIRLCPAQLPPLNASLIVLIKDKRPQHHPMNIDDGLPLVNMQHQWCYIYFAIVYHDRLILMEIPLPGKTVLIWEGTLSSILEWNINNVFHNICPRFSCGIFKTTLTLPDHVWVRKQFVLA